MNESDFCAGFALGFMAAGIAGFISTQIYLASKKAKEATKKQKIMGETEYTPMQAVGRYLEAQVKMVVLVALLIALALVAWRVYHALFP